MRKSLYGLFTSLYPPANWFKILHLILLFLNFSIFYQKIIQIKYNGEFIKWRIPYMGYLLLSYIILSSLNILLLSYHFFYNHYYILINIYKNYHPNPYSYHNDL